MALINASGYDPIVFPINGDVEPAQIDRAQSIDPSTSLNKEEVNEIGRDDALVGFVKGTPAVSYSMTQYEYGNMEFWKKLANKADSVQTIDLSDFRTPTFDICAYLTDDDDAVVGSLVYPKLRTSGFSLSIGDPDAIVERSFDLVGEEAQIFKGNNKYWVQEKHTASGPGDTSIDLSARAPEQLPDQASAGTEEEQYIFRVTHYDVSAGTTVELTETTDYTYSDTTKTLSIVKTIDTGDIIKVYYTSASAPALLWTPNDSDSIATRADSVSIYLYIPGSGKPASDDYLYKVQSITLDVTFDREDLKEIGNKEVVQRAVNDQTVTATIGRLVEQFTIEEVLRGEGDGYEQIDVSRLTDSASIIIQFFEDSTKGTFKYGMIAENMSPTDINTSIEVLSNTNAETVLEGKALKITEDNSVLGNL